MKILLLGSSGFIGRYVRDYLQQQGHTLVCPNSQCVDFLRFSGDDCLPYVEDVDVIINMVGIMHHQPEKLEIVHHHTPLAIAILAKQHAKNSAAKQNRTVHWVQLSALGADANQTIAFVGSKGRGDQALLNLADDNFQVTIARPSIVFGRGGASTELFINLARLPLLALPNAGNYSLQPVHVEDVAQGLCHLATQQSTPKTIINFTGATTGTLADYLNTLRQNIHRKPALRILTLPAWLSLLSALLAKQPSKGMLSPDSLALLEAGSAADNRAFSGLIGRQPRGYETFL